MAMGDIPAISAAAHTHSTYGLGNMASPAALYAGTTGGAYNAASLDTMVQNAQRRLIVGDMVHNSQAAAFHDLALEQKPAKVKKEKPVTRRLVQVFIADPDDNVPLDKALLYSGTQKFTDATDQELFFEIDIKSILDAYNAVRVTLINKKVKERTEMLEPVKIRDLKMTVVSIATF